MKKIIFLLVFISLILIGCKTQPETQTESSAEEPALLDLSCDSLQDFNGNLAAFNLQEEELPEPILNYYHEKNSWGEEFRALVFPQAASPYSETATAVQIAKLINKTGYQPGGLILITPLEFKSSIAKKEDLVNLTQLGTTFVKIEQYSDSQTASLEFRALFKFVKKDSKKTNAELGTIGKESFAYSQDLLKAGKPAGKAYAAVFRINNLLFTIEGIDLNSREKLLKTIEENYPRLCEKFEEEQS